MENLSMAMGPLAVGDLSGLDISWSTLKRRYEGQPETLYSRIAVHLDQKVGERL
ncbi:hypothetical protein [Caballeronia sp. 15711]|uniref:hypothetical protein n=1 Tax=Caballeronia sp. 15711 TaxID=3391029 RepID=UPI0039E6D019